MKIKKLIAMFMAGTMLVSSFSASALYSEKAPLLDAPRHTPGNKSLTGTLDTSAASTLFTVGGQTFALLDTDEQGNYFVIAEKYFSTRPYWDSPLIDTTLSKAEAKVDENGTPVTDSEGNQLYEFFWNKPENIDMDKVRWNPQQEGTVAYWLNNEFLTGANLPDEIRNNLVEHEWKNEAIDTNPAGMDWGSDRAARKLVPAEERGSYENFDVSILQHLDVPAYTTTSKLALLSTSEYQAYSDKIGIRAPVSGWKGMMSRTIVACGAATLSGSVCQPLSYLFIAPMQFHGTDNLSNATTVNKVNVAGDYVPTKNHYYIRPVFWLDKDFFKNEKIDITTAGADPLSEVKKNDYYTLSTAGYTDEEIESLGIELGIGQPKEIIDPMEGYGNYPAYSKLTATPANINLGKPEARDKFYFKVAVDDETVKSFVLLDRDSNGNYLVMAEDNYGNYKFYDCSASRELNNYEMTADKWNYDPTNPKSVAYHLDNDFLTNGQGVNLPESIKENIIGIKEGTTKPTWKVENNKVVDSTSFTDTQAMLKIAHEQYLAGNYDEIREIQASIVLPSYTEVSAYTNKIYVNHNAWDGPMTRTTHASAAMESDGTGVTYRAYFWRLYTSDAGNNNLRIDGETDNSTVWNTASYKIRPMFWLDKDFFKTEKVVATDIGSEVKKQIMQYNVADMDDIYTSAELEAIGYTNLPTITTPSVKGSVVVGQNLTVDYTFSSPVNGSTERGTTIQWYISDNAEGPWTAIEGATEKTYTIKSGDIDKYVKVVVTPMDILNSIGARTESTPKLLTEISLFEVEEEVWFYDEDGYDLTSLNGATYIEAEFGIKNLNPSTVTKTFIIAVYDHDGSLIKMNSVDLDIESSEEPRYYSVPIELDSALGAGCSCKAFIWESLDSMVPVAMGEFVPKA